MAFKYCGKQVVGAVYRVMQGAKVTPDIVPLGHIAFPCCGCVVRTIHILGLESVIQIQSSLCPGLGIQKSPSALGSLLGIGKCRVRSPLFQPHASPSVFSSHGLPT